MKKIFTSILFLTILLSAKSQVGTTVVISQVYGGGGNSAATYQNDFIELFNPTATSKSLLNWSVQYASATGTTWAVTKLTNFTLQPGQYYLVKLASGGAIGSLLPTEDATGSSNMSATNGKVVLSNDTLPVTSCLPNAAIVDMVGFGTGNCFEGSAAAPAGSNANGIFRASNGCIDTNNNSSDFSVAVAAPRNSSSPFNICAAPSPLLSVSPGTLAITASLGMASAASFANLSGTTLSPAVGNLTVTPAANLEISLSSSGPFVAAPATLLIPYTGSTLSSTSIYVRIAATAAQGLFSSSFDCSGGSASTVTVTVTGGVNQNYYNSKANLGLSNLNTWSSTMNGLGSSPTSFSADYQLFNIVNQTNANYIGTWDVSNTGKTSRIVVGDGINPISFSILPDADSLTSATRIDILNNATLRVFNIRRPFFNTIATGSTIDFSTTGTAATDTIKFPALVYHNLTLSGGFKHFSTGTTTIRGNLTIDGVNSINGAVTSVSKANLFGNLIFTSNISQFDPNETGRMTIGMNGQSGTQQINSNGSEIKLYRLQRDTTTSINVISMSANSILTLGNSNGGGLQMNQSGANTTTLNLGTGILNFVSGSFVTSSSTGKMTSTAATINISKSAGTSNFGNLRFTSGSVLSNLKLDFGSSIANDTATLFDSVSVVNLNLIKGKLVVNASALLSMPQTGAVTGGSVSAYVDGKMKRTSAAAMFFPSGNKNKYAPVTVTPTVGGLNSYTTQYFFKAYSNFIVDPVTLSSFPNYNVSWYEYWTIDQATAGSADVKFSFLDNGSSIQSVASLRVAHNDGTDWNDIGGTVTPGSIPDNGSITATNVSVFSPFTLASPNLGVIPVKLEYIRGQKTATTNNLNWKVTCLSNSITMKIERSKDIRNFDEIGSISATQTRCSQPFDFIDALPLSGNNYYRLKLIDIDGKVTYSPVVVINNKNKGFEIVGLYPSMVTNETSLSLFSEKASSIETRITDMSGKTILLSRYNVPAGSSLIKLDASTLATGYYNLTILDANNSITTIRFIKQ